MFKKFILLFLCPLCLFGEVSLVKPKSGDLVVNNRILLKINGKPITVVDVVKKMDLIFYRQFPQYINNTMAKYEFYMTNFQALFFALVNDHMIMADSEDKEVEISDGDIREELEKMFGPDVVANIDSIGMTFEEAWDLLKRELTVRRMNQMMVRSKAMSEVQPKELKVMYEEYLKQNPELNVWRYQILTFKGTDRERLQDIAERAYLQISEKNIAPKEVVFKETDVEFSLSDEFERHEREISAAHREVLESLKANSYSKPIVLANPRQNNFIARIFYLNEQKKNSPLSFGEMQDELEMELLQKGIEKHGQVYAEKLRDRYGIHTDYLSQMIPADFVPFSLR